MNEHRRLIVSFLGMGLWSHGASHAQTSSGPPLSFLVPQPAGNPTDTLARRLLTALQRELGQHLVVENVPGAGGSLGVNKMLAAPAGASVLMIAEKAADMIRGKPPLEATMLKD